MNRDGRVTLAVIVAIVAIVTASAVGRATAAETSHSLKGGSTAFTIKIAKPRKAILYPEASKVSTSYLTVCLKGATVSSEHRSFTTSYTRNLLYLIPPRQDTCWISVAGATATDRGQIVVDFSSR